MGTIFIVYQDLVDFNRFVDVDSFNEKVTTSIKNTVQQIRTEMSDVETQEYEGTLNKILDKLTNFTSNNGASTLIIALAFHQFTKPVRFGVTLVTVPALVRHLRKFGYFKK